MDFWLVQIFWHNVALLIKKKSSYWDQNKLNKNNDKDLDGFIKAIDSYEIENKEKYLHFFEVMHIFKPVLVDCVYVTVTKISEIIKKM